MDELLPKNVVDVCVTTPPRELVDGVVRAVVNLEVLELLDVVLLEEVIKVLDGVELLEDEDDEEVDLEVEIDVEVDEDCEDVVTMLEEEEIEDL